MRRQISTFNVASQTALAALQPNVAFIPLILNQANLPEGTIGFPQYERTISLTSLTDLSAINYLITGVNILGETITETLSGPDTDTVSSTLRYHSITSIVPDATDNGLIAVGSSDDAVTLNGINAVAVSQWFLLDNFVPYFTTTIQAVCDDTPTIKYTIDSTCTEIQTPVLGGMPINTPAVFPIVGFDGATGSGVVSLTNVASAYRITINTVTASSLTTTILQQGV